MIFRNSVIVRPEQFCKSCEDKDDQTDDKHHYALIMFLEHLICFTEAEHKQ